MKPTCASKAPTWKTVYRFWLNGEAPCPTSWYSTQPESAQLTPTPRMVIQCAPALPTWRPNNPATMLPSNGARTTARSRFLEISRPVIGASAFQTIDFGHVDRVPGAEQGDQDGQADGGLRGGHGQDEEHEDLPVRITELARERDEVDVHRQQHQLDRHQQHDDVLAVEEDAGDADAEQHRAQREQVAQGDHGLTSGSAAAGAIRVSRTGFSTATSTMRRRSDALVRACSAGFWVLVPGRLRRVSMTAAITATVRITAANSNGSRNLVNSVCASHLVLETLAAADAALAAYGVASLALKPIKARISTSITTATSRPTGR